jgi:hypothetical protein
VRYEPSWEAVPELVASVLAESAAPTLLVTMGAGDVTEIGPRVLTLLRARAARGSPDGSAAV